MSEAWLSWMLTLVFEANIKLLELESYFSLFLIGETPLLEAPLVPNILPDGLNADYRLLVASRPLSGLNYAEASAIFSFAKFVGTFCLALGLFSSA